MHTCLHFTCNTNTGWVDANSVFFSLQMESSLKSSELFSAILPLPLDNGQLLSLTSRQDSQAVCIINIMEVGSFIILSGIGTSFKWFCWKCEVVYIRKVC